MSPATIAALLRRADNLFYAGDVLSARLLYERAAAGGSGAGATGVAKTYDPPVLAVIGARGLRGDAELAADWYRKGIALGDREAPGLLQALTSRDVP